jgi:dTDP-4-dehydrorhamnose 3,5-epimerase-like enzyme
VIEVEFSLLLGNCTSTTLIPNVKNVEVIVMVKCKIFLNPKFFSTGFQMLSKNVYINMLVHDAFNKMKISHF